MITLFRNLTKALLRRLFRLQAALYVSLCTEPTRLTVTVTQHLPAPEDAPRRPTTYRDLLERLYVQSPSRGSTQDDDTRLG